MIIGKQIKAARKQNEMSVEDMIASLCMEGYRVSRQTVVNWENGDTFPNANDIVYLCRVFGKSVSFWFGKDTTRGGNCA